MGVMDQDGSLDQLSEWAWVSAREWTQVMLGAIGALWTTQSGRRRSSQTYEGSQFD